MRENEAAISQMRLHNPHEFPVAFKVKLTHRFRYNVRPCVAIVDPESVADVHGVFQPPSVAACPVADGWARNPQSK